MTGWRFWIDQGGTFTDIVAQTPDGRLVTHKRLSSDFAAEAGIRHLQSLAPGPITEIRMGTTVATNALLERTGEPTLLAVTQGFADLLAIGTGNRPDLFARAIHKPPPLYNRVIEIPERRAADGHVIRPLDKEATRQRLEEAYAQGARAVAVVLLHSWREPAHEIQVGLLARQIGFTQVTLSHQACPRIKAVARGDTAVADAALSPVLRRHAGRLERAFPGVRCLFMQSSGGLVDGAGFHGKDAVLSGPAGGVIGGVRSALEAGFPHLIGFDMGGTSTDVWHWRGEFERDLETTVGGIRLSVPMMRIHTVAAGGGSVLSFDGARFRAGPASAGADPGPACYRKGGPLTITDANLILGRLDPSAFPAVFGPNGDLGLDRDAARLGFERLAKKTGRTPEQVAEGFLAVAVQTMAEAIKTISSQRGHDPAGATLVCFGGAGGQHAAAVADALGIGTVFLHRLAGLLSAYGIGLADFRVLRERAVETPLGDAVPDGLEDLAAEAVGELARQNVAVRDVIRRLRLRYDGSDGTIEVTAGPAAAVAQDFANTHRARFGFTLERRLIVAALVVEAIGGAPAPMVPAVTGQPPPPRRTRVFIEGAWHDAPLIGENGVPPGGYVDGVCILADQASTIVVPPGWRAERTLGGAMILRRVVAAPKRVAAGTSVDPVLLEVFNALFMSVAERMGVALANSAQSVNIKERLDFSCAVFDADGALIANAPHIPVHLGSMGEAVRAVLAAYRGTLRPGQSFVLNSPFAGGTHLPDITVVSPVFASNPAAPLFWVAARGHHADIGGITPGSMPPGSTRLDQEGVVIEPQLLVEDGVFHVAAIRALLASPPEPARAIDQNIGDLQAQLAANTRGAGELLDLVDRYGSETVLAYMGHVRANAEACVRQRLATLADGTFSVAMDDGAVIRVAVTIDRHARRAIIDFTGSSPQRPNNANAPLAVTKAAVLYVLRLLIDKAIPLNEGCLAPVTLQVPKGSLLNPEPGAAVAAGNVETSQAVVDALLGALGAMAASQGTMNNLTFGDHTHQYYETIGGGAGGGPGFDGASGVQTHMTNSRITDPEILELRHPVRVEQFSLRPGSGGKGRWRGGDGLLRRLRFLAPMTAAILSNRRRVAPFGLNGGDNGKPGLNRVERASGQVEDLPGTAEISVNKGDCLVIETPGGGGYGD